MINLTESIQVIVTNNILNNAIRDSIKDTHTALLSRYLPTERKPSLSKITSSSKNPLKKLSFLKFYPIYETHFDNKWLINTFNIVHTTNTSNLNIIAAAKVSKDLGFNETIPISLLMPLLRGLRIFFIALWKRKSILLPMSFSLPATSKGVEIASSLYTEVLSIYRKPFKPDQIKSLEIEPHIPQRSKNNLNWYAWRPIIASTWHTVEEITEEDLIALFRDLKDRRTDVKSKNKRKEYPLSVNYFLNPLYAAAKERCHFDINKVVLYNTRKGLELSEIEENKCITDEESFKTKTLWETYERKYINNLRYVKRIKSYSKQEKTLGKLNNYLFCVLPSNETRTPTPKEFGRHYIDGIGAPRLGDSLINKSELSTIQSFFGYLEAISDFEESLHGFINPILEIDMPTERRRRNTSKKTLNIDNFRLFYHLMNAIADFSWHIAREIGKGNAPENWIRILSDPGKHQVLSASDFNYIPRIIFSQTDDSTVDFLLKWIPTTVIPVGFFYLKSYPNRKMVLPKIHGINQTIVAIETSLRHIHIRWLDKHTYKLSEPAENSESFDLLVNTDKSHWEWNRPASLAVFATLQRQIESQTWIQSDHFESRLCYDKHEETPFLPVCPIFMQYDKTCVFSEESNRDYFKQLMYFYCQIQNFLGHKTSEKLPPEVSDLEFTRKIDFETAIKCKKYFKSTMTPHSTRATVISQKSLILPASIIGKKVSGHNSENMVRYYTRINSDYIHDLIYVNRKVAELSRGDNSFGLSAHTNNTLERLKAAVETRPLSEVLADFGAFSFPLEDQDGKHRSGISIIASNNDCHIAINPTHICPFNNCCPDEVLKSTGRFSCGQCPYSVKTVDNLPRILAQCRSLARQLDHLKEKLTYAHAKKASEESLESIESELLQIACELSAWSLSADVLSRNCERLKHKALVSTPDIINSKLMAVTPKSALENLIVQCEEAASYPELANASLALDITKVKHRLLQMKNPAANLFNDCDAFSAIDDIRGLIRGAAIASGISIVELAIQIENSPLFMPLITNKIEGIYGQA